MQSLSTPSLNMRLETGDSIPNVQSLSTPSLKN